jgi:uncharacterized protein
VQAGERMTAVDVVRGFALLGILIFNMSSFAGYSLDWRAHTSPLDQAIVLLTHLLVQAKFYSLFSFLFGWGMAVQLLRSRARRVHFVPRSLRRLLVLLFIGMVHGMLIWDGDILTAYALSGFLLVLLRNRSGKVLLPFALLCLLFSIFVTLPVEPAERLREAYQEWTVFLRSGRYSRELFTSPVFSEVTRVRVQSYLNRSAGYLYYFGNIFAMFLLGLWAGKQRILQDSGGHRRLLRWTALLGFILGLMLNAVFVGLMVWPQAVPADWLGSVRVGARTLGAPALMLFYLSAILLLYQRPSWQRRLGVLAPLGRTALSSYIGQSLFCTLVFYGYGLGLYGQVGPAFGLLLTVLIYAVQIRLSAWWLGRFRFGPLEWLWRSLTYLRLQPLRGPGVPAAGAHAAGRAGLLVNLLLLFGLAAALAWALLQGA